MIVPDTSVLVAAFASWHESHEIANRRLGRESSIVAHTAFEFVSTMTRLPDPYRVDAAPAIAFLTARSREPWLTLDATQSSATLRNAVESAIVGGALYDALIAATAQAHDATVITLDRRAEPTYRRVGARIEVLEPGTR